MAASEVLRSTVGGALSVKLVTVSDITKSAYEAAFASSALPVAGLIDVTVPHIARGSQMVVAADGFERKGLTSFTTPDITINVFVAATDTGTAALKAAVVSGAQLAFKYVNAGTGLIDYWQGQVSSAVFTPASGDAYAGYEITVIVPPLSILNDQTAPA